MTQKRLNNMMLLYVHKECVSSLDILGVANVVMILLTLVIGSLFFGEFTFHDLCFSQNKAMQDQGTQTRVKFSVKN